MIYNKNIKKFPQKKEICLKKSVYINREIYFKEECMHIIKEKVFTEYPSFESQYDEAAKHIMSFKPILASLLKFCIDDYKDLSIHEISNQYLIHQLSSPLFILMKNYLV
jgi:hypothetical protein